MNDLNTAMLDRPARFGAEEWQARVELAAMYRIFDMLGWTELIYNHITLRLPGPDRHFLINPFGLHYSEVTASNLVRIDLDGNIVGESAWPVNPAGFTVHAAIHAHIPDAHCVMHTHTTAGMAVACSRDGLSMSNFYSAQLHGKLAYHDFEGITVHADECPRLLASIGDRQAVILRNHGLLSWADSLPRAFAILWLLNRACEIQVASMSIGPVREISEDIQRKCTRDSLQFNPKFGVGPRHARRADPPGRPHRSVLAHLTHEDLHLRRGRDRRLSRRPARRGGPHDDRGRARRDARGPRPPRPAAAARGRHRDGAPVQAADGPRRARSAGSRRRRGQGAGGRRDRRAHRTAARIPHDGAGGDERRAVVVLRRHAGTARRHALAHARSGRRHRRRDTVGAA